MNRTPTTRGQGRVLSLVDAHQHFQDITHHVYPWLSDRTRPPQLEGDLDPIRRDYLPEDYAGDVAGFDVKKTVHVQNGWNPAESQTRATRFHILCGNSSDPNERSGTLENSTRDRSSS